MALSEIELKRCEKEVASFMKQSRPPAHILNEFDLGYRIEGQSIEIFEVRPEWRYPQNKIEIPVAKSTYVKTQGVWKVYWQRRDLK